MEHPFARAVEAGTDLVDNARSSTGAACCVKYGQGLKETLYHYGEQRLTPRGRPLGVGRLVQSGRSDGTGENCSHGLLVFRL